MVNYYDDVETVATDCETTEDTLCFEEVLIVSNLEELFRRGRQLWVVDKLNIKLSRSTIFFDFLLFFISIKKKNWSLIQYLWSRLHF